MYDYVFLATENEARIHEVADRASTAGKPSAYQPLLESGQTYDRRQPHLGQADQIGKNTVGMFMFSKKVSSRGIIL